MNDDDQFMAYLVFKQYCLYYYDLKISDEMNPSEIILKCPVHYWTYTTYQFYKGYFRLTDDQRTLCLKRNIAQKVMVNDEIILL